MSLLHIVGGTVFDAIHGEVIRNGVVCIEDDHITAVGSASAISTGGRDVQVIDATGHFVMPGMMDCHVHLLSSGAPDYAIRGLKELFPTLRFAAQPTPKFCWRWATPRCAMWEPWATAISPCARPLRMGSSQARASWPPATH